MLNRNFLVGCGIGGGGHKYWRVRFTGAPQQESQQYAYTLEMRGSAGSPDLCVGGTATHSTRFVAGYEGDKAFDANDATLWIAGTSESTTDWLKYAFLGAVDIKQIRLKGNATQLVLEWSDDDSAWTPVKTWNHAIGDYDETFDV